MHNTVQQAATFSISFLRVFITGASLSVFLYFKLILLLLPSSACKVA